MSDWGWGRFDCHGNRWPAEWRSYLLAPGEACSRQKEAPGREHRLVRMRISRRAGAGGVGEMGRVDRDEAGTGDPGLESGGHF